MGAYCFNEPHFTHLQVSSLLNDISIEFLAISANRYIGYVDIER